LLAAYREAKDLIEIGAYVAGPTRWWIVRSNGVTPWLDSCARHRKTDDSDDNWRTMRRSAASGTWDEKRYRFR